VIDASTNHLIKSHLDTSNYLSPDVPSIDLSANVLSLSHEKYESLQQDLYCSEDSNQQSVPVAAPEGGGNELPVSKFDSGSKNCDLSNGETLDSETLQDLGTSEPNRMYDCRDVGTASMLPGELGLDPVDSEEVETRLVYTRECLLQYHFFCTSRDSIEFNTNSTGFNAEDPKAWDSIEFNSIPFMKMAGIQTTATAPLFLSSSSSSNIEQDRHAAQSLHAFSAYEEKFKRTDINALRKVAVAYGLKPDGDRAQLVSLLVQKLCNKSKRE